MPWCSSAWLNYSPWGLQRANQFEKWNPSRGCDSGLFFYIIDLRGKEPDWLPGFCTVFCVWSTEFSQDEEHSSRTKGGKRHWLVSELIDIQDTSVYVGAERKPGSKTVKDHLLKRILQIHKPTQKLFIRLSSWAGGGRGIPGRMKIKTSAFYRRRLNASRPDVRSVQRQTSPSLKFQVMLRLKRKKKSHLWHLFYQSSNPHPRPTLNRSTSKKEQLEQECLTDGNFHLNNFFSPN